MLKMSTKRTLLFYLYAHCVQNSEIELQQAYISNEAQYFVEAPETAALLIPVFFFIK